VVEPEELSMKKETTFVLAAIVAVMLGFIVFYEQGTLSSGELESRRGQVLDRFVRPRVHHIRLERGDEVVVDLERDQEAEETLDTFDVGTWRLTAPVTGAADPDAIDSLLLACEALSARRTIEHPSAEDRTRFGLDAPRMVLTVEVADETQVVRVGAHDEGLDADYVEVVGVDRVHLVGQDFFEALDQQTDQFRSKELFEELATRDVTAMTLRYAHDGAAETEARVALVEHRWVASAPFRGWARHGVVLGIVDALLDARVARYLADGESLVASPTVALTLTTKERDAEGRDTGRLREVDVRVGARCEPAPSDEGVELLAVRIDDGAVVCVSRQALETLLGSEATLRETRLLAATDDQVERFVFGRGAGSDTDAVLEVRRDEDRWQLREGEISRAADAQAVSEFLAALHAAEAESFEDVSDASLAARGLDAPRMRLRVHRSDDESIVEYVDVGAVDTVGVWVRRGEEPVLARYVGGVEELLVPSGLRFRARDVITREADDVLSFSITREGVEERLSTENGAWRIEAPYALAADRIATRDVVRALTSLRATRWVGDEADASMGLASPRLRVHLAMRAPTAAGEHDDDAPDAGAPLPTEIDLLVGAVTEGGAFARLEAEAAVFVLPADVLAAISAPLVDREVVALDTSSATRITLTVRGASVVIERSDGSWRSGDAVAAPDATDAFLERLRSLRARGVLGYGERASFASPEIVVAVESPSGTRRLEVGGTTGEGEGAYAPARVSDVNAELQLSPEIVGAIASYRP
jgi:hypothetical protein